jgi:predicted nucleic acid-binding Zn ribbon protein
MKRSNTQNLGEVIKQYLKEMNIDEKLKEVRVPHLWEEIIGKSVASKTDNIYVKNKVLYVHLNSSIVRNELLMMKDGIIDAINKKMGENVIEDMVLK